jgi:hypothetical protein
MADIPQVLATYDALVRVAFGADLTYGFVGASTDATRRRERTRRVVTTGAIKWGDAISAFAQVRRLSGHTL